MAQIKGSLEERLRRSIATSPYTLVLNWGPWGGGKTHAAKFFSQDHVLEEISGELGRATPKSVVVNVPRGSKNVVRELYRNVIGFVGIENISSDLHKVRQEIGNDAFRTIARKYTSDSGLSQALFRLSGGGGQGTPDLFLDDGSGPGNTLRRYFNGETTRSDIKDLGLPRNIDSANDYIKILSSVINIVTYEEGENLPVYSEFIIWIDEMEEIKSLPGKQQTVLSGTIRDLTDYIPKNISILLNFSSAPGGEYEDLGAFLGGAVWDRVREENEFRSLNREAFETYVIDLLNNPKFETDNSEYEGIEPFTRQALDLLFDKLQPAVYPRRINEMMSLVLEEFVMEASTGGDYIIDEEFVDSISDLLAPIAQRGKYQSI